MGRSNVTAMRELALRRAAIAKALKMPLPKGGALRKIMDKRRQQQRQELAAVDQQLTDLKNEVTANGEGAARMQHRQDSRTE